MVELSSTDESQFQDPSIQEDEQPLEITKTVEYTQIPSVEHDIDDIGNSLEENIVSEVQQEQEERQEPQEQYETTETENLTVQDPTSEKSKSSNEIEPQDDSQQPETEFTMLLERRNEISQNELKHYDNDEVFAVPETWYSNFTSYQFGPNDKNIHRALGPIDLAPLVDINGLTISRNASYLFISAKSFHKLVEWYGLVNNGINPISRRVFISNYNNQLQVDSDLLIMYPHILCPPFMINRFKDLKFSPFLISKTATVKNLKEKLKRIFDITKTLTKIWKIEFDYSQIDISNYNTNNNNSNNIPEDNEAKLPIILTSSNLNLILNKEIIRVSKSSGKFSTLESRKIHSCHILLELAQPNNTWLMEKYNTLKLGTGLIGLNNLGNSCYMNSALQCLVHIPELMNYFIYEYYKNEINYDNPLGNNGKIALSFAGLISNLFDYRLNKNIHSFAPREFKSTIGYYNSMFSGYHQQDSQELIAFLLDGLHEDLNRILKKPYTEKPELPDDKVNDPIEVSKLAQDCWNIHKLRNNSVIIDLFVGLYKSTLICPVCSKVSITFDPYNDLTLPLPIKKNWFYKIKLLLDDGSYPKSFEVELNKSSTFHVLKNYISGKLNIPVNELISFELFNSQFYKNFQRSKIDKDINYLPVSDLITEGDDIWFYHIKKTNPSDLVIPIFNTLSDGDSYVKAFGIPFFIVVELNKVSDYYYIRKKIELKYNQLSSFQFFNEDYYNNNEDNLKKIDNFFKMKIFDSSNEIKQNRYNNSYRSYNSSFHARRKFSIGDGGIENTDEISVWVPQTNNNFTKLRNILDKIKMNDDAAENDEDEDDLYNTEDKNSTNSTNVLEFDTLPEDNDIDENGEADTTINTEMDIDLDTSGNNDIDKQEEQKEEDDEDGDEGVLAGRENTIDMISHEVDSVSIDEPRKQKLQPLSEIVGINSESDETIELNIINNQEPLVEFKNAIVCEWNQDSFDEFFSMLGEEGNCGKETWTKPEIIHNEEVENNKRIMAEELKKNLSLDKCLNYFAKSEILSEDDLWYCPNCKDHRQATKKLEIWSVPDILTIHLKRFENTKSFSDKIDAIVEFPIENLDMSKYIVNPLKNNETIIYDLFAVDNHYGGLGGGHYTSYVKNDIDNEWYYFDDSRVSKTNPLESIRGSAYLLFYRRRSDKPLGGEFFTKMYEDISGKEFSNKNLFNDVKDEAVDYEKSGNESIRELDQEGGEYLGVDDDDDDDDDDDEDEDEDHDNGDIVDISDDGVTNNEYGGRSVDYDKDEDEDEDYDVPHTPIDVNIPERPHIDPVDEDMDQAFDDNSSFSPTLSFQDEGEHDDEEYKGDIEDVHNEGEIKLESSALVGAIAIPSNVSAQASDSNSGCTSGSGDYVDVDDDDGDDDCDDGNFVPLAGKAGPSSLKVPENIKRRKKMFDSQSKSSTGTDESSSPIIEPSNAKNFATNSAVPTTIESGDKPAPATSVASSALVFNLPTPLLKSASTTTTTSTSILSNSITGSGNNNANTNATHTKNINSGKFEFDSNVASPDSSQEEIDNVSSCSESAVAPTN